MAVTYNDLYLDLRRKLKAAGVEMATLEARELAGFAAGKTREEFYRDSQLYASAHIEERVAELLERRLKGEPVAYLIGEWEFYGLPLDISRHVLIPRVDTEVLAEEAISYLKNQGECRVLDLCAGSGCVGIAVAAHVPGAHVVLAELSEEALKVCRQNIRRNNLSGRVIPLRADALEPPSGVGEFQCIVCNPPYIPTGEIDTLDGSVRDYEPHMALDGGTDGYRFYRAITEKWRQVLAPGGRLYYEVGIGQADEVLRMMRKAGFGDLQIVRDTGGISRVVYGTLCTEV